MSMQEYERLVHLNVAEFQRFCDLPFPQFFVFQLVGFMLPVFSDFWLQASPA